MACRLFGAQPISETMSLRWRHNDGDSVSDHQPHDCLLNCLFGRTSKKTSKLRVTGLCAGNSPWTSEFPHKWPVTRKMFLFDDVIMSTFWQLVPWEQTSMKYQSNKTILSKKIALKMSPANWLPFYLGLNVLRDRLLTKCLCQLQHFSWICFSFILWDELIFSLTQQTFWAVPLTVFVLASQIFAHVVQCTFNIIESFTLQFPIWQHYWINYIGISHMQSYGRNDRDK